MRALKPGSRLQRGTDLTASGLQKTAYALLLALVVYVWFVGG